MNKATQVGTVAGIQLESKTMSEAVREIMELALSGQPSYACFVDAHMLVCTHDNPLVRNAVASATLRFPDGSPLAWLLRIQNRRARRLSGPNTTIEVLKQAEANDIPVAFYGTLCETLNRISCHLKKVYPRLRVALMYSPPFGKRGPGEIEADLKLIRDSGARILFVGLGCPKQEIWMHQYANRLPCISLGVGAAFRVLAREIVLPPNWIQAVGLTWLFRLLQEPRHLAKRILFYLPRFLVLIALPPLSTNRAGKSEISSPE